MIKKIFYWITGKRRNRVLRDTIILLQQFNEEYYKKISEVDIMEKTKAIVLKSTTNENKYLELDFFSWYDSLEISKRCKLAKALKLQPGDRLEVSFKKLMSAKK